MNSSFKRIAEYCFIVLVSLLLSVIIMCVFHSICKVKRELLWDKARLEAYADESAKKYAREFTDRLRKKYEKTITKYIKPQN